LDAEGADHSAALGVIGRVLKQSRLADPGLALDYEGTARATANRIDELIQNVAFAPTPRQLRHVLNNKDGQLPTAAESHG
jgi:hypothetical protein